MHPQVLGDLSAPAAPRRHEHRLATLAQSPICRVFEGLLQTLAFLTVQGHPDRHVGHHWRIELT
tara:strand:+ start:574 stop:765 length:192 start_codon:yes stop_codon:yes gene_type:complete